jgi:ribonuclease Z
MKMTLTSTADTYTVHELLRTQDSLTPCYTSDSSINHSLEHQIMHCSELPGLDIRCSPEDGFWRNLTQSRGVFGEVFVDAGPILHRGLHIDS